VSLAPRPMLKRLLVTLVGIGCALGCVAGTASADDDNFNWELPDRSYLWDGGAVPFLYLPLAMTLGIRGGNEPPADPIMFSEAEGGKDYSGGQYPVTMLYVDAAVAGGLILVGGDDSRWFHLKGFAQGMITTNLLTALAKNTFGRHRPMYDLTPGAVNPPDSSKSFFSGHSSATLATATYLALYARQHLFNRWRPEGEFRWWEGAAYLGLAAGALAVPYSQYALNRHHASDVIVGSAVGAGVSALFYVYQESRYRSWKRGPSESGLAEPMELSIVPNTGINGITIMGTW
jgi:membrane-associated phospholipid phosphatase